MTEEQAERLEQKLDTILECIPTINALGDILVRRHVAIDRAGLGKNTLDSHPAFEEIGKRKTFIEIGELAAIKRRKRTVKRSK